jgi:hypothetical protein
MDGKTLRDSRGIGGRQAVRMVSAWANMSQLNPGQVKADEKSNEITAIPKLLEVLSLKGCTGGIQRAFTGNSLFSCV